MKNKREIYFYIVEHRSIFLPMYQLNKLIEHYNSNKKTIGNNILDCICLDYDKYINPTKGAYSDLSEHTKYLTKASTPIQKIDKDTDNVVGEYKSLYAAAKDLNGAVVNISRAAKKDGTAYGFKWKLLKK